MAPYRRSQSEVDSAWTQHVDTVNRANEAEAELRKLQRTAKAEIRNTEATLERARLDRITTCLAPLIDAIDQRSAESRETFDAAMAAIESHMTNDGAAQLAAELTAPPASEPATSERIESDHDDSALGTGSGHLFTA